MHMLRIKNTIVKNVENASRCLKMKSQKYLK